MYSIITASLIATTMALPPSPERIQQLVKKLEVPTRLTTDSREGPPDYPWPTFNFHRHSRECDALYRAGDAAVPALLALIEDKSKPGQARGFAAGFLMERVVGTKVKPDRKIIDAINAALKDKDPSLRYWTVTCLGCRGLASIVDNWNTWKKKLG